MLDSRDSSGCGLEKEIVAYVYSDMEPAERRSFESHLDGCKSCPDEIAAFSSVSMAISDWKTSRFDQLETPGFSPEEDGAAKENVIIPQAEGSVFGKLSELFGFSPAMWQAATAFGALLLTAGIIWFGFGNSFTEKEIAEVPPVIKKTEAAVPVPDVAAVDDTFLVNEVEEPARETVSNVKQNQEPVKVTTRKTPSQLNRNAVNEKRTVEPTSTKKAPVDTTEPLPVVPRLTQLAEVDDEFEDTEDTGLRLSDLFAGSDSEKR